MNHFLENRSIVIFLTRTPSGHYYKQKSYLYIDYKYYLLKK